MSIDFHGPSLRDFAQTVASLDDNRTIKTSGDSVKSTALPTWASTNNETMSSFLAAIRNEYGDQIVSLLVDNNSPGPNLGKVIKSGGKLTAGLVKLTLDTLNRKSQDNIVIKDSFLAQMDSSSGLDKVVKEALGPFDQNMTDKGRDILRNEFIKELNQQFPANGPSFTASDLQNYITERSPMHKVMENLSATIIEELPGSMDDKIGLSIQLFTTSGPDGMVLGLQSLATMRGIQPEGPLTQETIWQGTFNETMPPSAKGLNFAEAFASRQSSHFESLAPGQGKALGDLCSHMPLNRAREILVNHQPITLKDLSAPDKTLQPVRGKISTPQRALTTDIPRRKDTVARGTGEFNLVKEEPTLVLNGETFKIGKNTDFAFKDDEDLSSYKTGKASTFSNSIIEGFKKICGNENADDRQVEALALLSSQAPMSKLVSQNSGVFKNFMSSDITEHSSTTVKITSPPENSPDGKVTVSISTSQDPEVRSFSGGVDLQYEVSRDGSINLLDLKVSPPEKRFLTADLQVLEAMPNGADKNRAASDLVNKTLASLVNSSPDDVMALIELRQTLGVASEGLAPLANFLETRINELLDASEGSATQPQSRFDRGALAQLSSTTGDRLELASQSLIENTLKNINEPEKRLTALKELRQDLASVTENPAIINLKETVDFKTAELDSLIETDKVPEDLEAVSRFAQHYFDLQEQALSRSFSADELENASRDILNKALEGSEPDHEIHNLSSMREFLLTLEPTDLQEKLVGDLGLRISTPQESAVPDPPVETVIETDTPISTSSPSGPHFSQANLDDLPGLEDSDIGPAMLKIACESLIDSFVESGTDNELSSLISLMNSIPDSFKREGDKADFLMAALNEKILNYMFLNDLDSNLKPVLANTLNKLIPEALTDFSNNFIQKSIGNTNDANQKLTILTEIRKNFNAETSNERVLANILDSRIKQYSKAKVNIDPQQLNSFNLMPEGDEKTTMGNALIDTALLGLGPNRLKNHITEMKNLRTLAGLLEKMDGGPVLANQVLNRITESSKYPSITIRPLASGETMPGSQVNLQDIEPTSLTQGYNTCFMISVARGLVETDSGKAYLQQRISQDDEGNYHVRLTHHGQDFLVKVPADTLTGPSSGPDAPRPEAISVLEHALVQFMEINNIDNYAYGELGDASTTGSLLGLQTQLFDSSAQSINDFLDRNKATNQPVSVVFRDTDHFKTVGNVLGDTAQIGNSMHPESPESLSLSYLQQGAANLSSGGKQLLAFSIPG